MKNEFKYGILSTYFNDTARRTRMVTERTTPRTVLVTGGSRGIGAACVRRFSENGDRVAFFYRTNESAALDVARETGALALRVDIRNSKEVQNGIDRVRAALGEISVLVNNAGVSKIGLFTDLSDEDWNQIIETNLTGTFFVTRATLPDMIHQKQGRIINIGSMWGKVGASCEVAYSASKAGLRGFTMALAKELGPSGITVNCIAPGAIRTPMLDCFTEEDLAALAEETPVGRIGTPEDVATACVFLASEGAQFITGQVLGVNGGFVI